MSNEVYFNEPGYDRELNTESGKKKNCGYSNIVKWANVKYAMIDQILNPAIGFEIVVMQHFANKHKRVSAEVKTWID